MVQVEGPGLLHMGVAVRSSGSPVVCDDCIRSGRPLGVHCSRVASSTSTAQAHREEESMDREGSSNDGSGDRSLADGGGRVPTEPSDPRVVDRRQRAGRLGYIQFAVSTQRHLANISKDVKISRVQLDEYGVPLTEEQVEKLILARQRIMEAADSLHSLASELLGDMKKEE